MRRKWRETTANKDFSIQKFVLDAKILVCLCKYVDECLCLPPCFVIVPFTI